MSTATPYEKAVVDLNGLQSNTAVLAMLRASRGSINIYSLPEMREYWRRLGHEISDLNALNAIHVTGTKGKGSTCAFTDSIIRSAPVKYLPRGGEGLRVGLFTSPHLMEVRERIRVNGAPMKKDDFARYFNECRSLLLEAAREIQAAPEGSIPEDRFPNMPPLPSYFRFLNMMAFHAFLDMRVDVAIVEVGVGGEYDPTNILPSPWVCGITALGIDHQMALGDTVEKIAWHKGGIMKAGVPAFTVAQPSGAMEVLKERSQEIGAASLSIAPPLPLAADGTTLPLGLKGAHQRGNAELAVALATAWLERCNGKGLSIPEGAARSAWVREVAETGLAKAYWPGRAHIYTPSRAPGLEGDAIVWYFDGAHTKESLSACASWFKEEVSSAGELPRKENVLVFNCTHGREGARLLAPLLAAHAGHLFSKAYFCTNVTYTSRTFKADLQNNVDELDTKLELQHELATTWKDGGGAISTGVYGSIEEVVTAITKDQEDSGIPRRVLVTGSLHLVGGVMSILGMEV